jgi:hypothetical protein
MYLNRGLTGSAVYDLSTARQQSRPWRNVRRRDCYRYLENSDADLERSRGHPAATPSSMISPSNHQHPDPRGEGLEHRGLDTEGAQDVFGDLYPMYRKRLHAGVNHHANIRSQRLTYSIVRALTPFYRDPYRPPLRLEHIQKLKIQLLPPGTARCDSMQAFAPKNPVKVVFFAFYLKLPAKFNLDKG